MSRKLSLGTENIGEKQERSLLAMLGESIWCSLSDMIINDCLEKSTPKTSAQVNSLFCCVVLGQLTETRATNSAIAGFQSRDILA